MPDMRSGVSQRERRAQAYRRTVWTAAKAPVSRPTVRDLVLVSAVGV